VNFSWKKFWSAIVVCCGFCVLAASPTVTLKTQLDIHKDLTPDRSPRAYRILFIGASIMLHGVGDWTLKMGWDHEAGMAASSAEKDYVHLLSGKIQGYWPERRIGVYYHNYGGSGSAANRLAALSRVAPVKPHLVIVQLGGHEKSLAEFQDGLHKLLAALQAMDSHPKVICTGIWDPSDHGKFAAYQGNSAAADQMIARECALFKIPYVSVEKYALDPKCSGWGTHPGVQWHPNDNGHRGYADELFSAFLTLQQ